MFIEIFTVKKETTPKPTKQNKSYPNILKISLVY